MVPEAVRVSSVERRLVTQVANKFTNLSEHGRQCAVIDTIMHAAMVFLFVVLRVDTTLPTIRIGSHFAQLMNELKAIGCFWTIPSI